MKIRCINILENIFLKISISPNRETVMLLYPGHSVTHSKYVQVCTNKIIFYERLSKLHWCLTDALNYFYREENDNCKVMIFFPRN
jgi:hypothetical protein